jgi:hypothetical protein
MKLNQRSTQSIRRNSFDRIGSSQFEPWRCERAAYTSKLEVRSVHSSYKRTHEFVIANEAGRMRQSTP